MDSEGDSAVPADAPPPPPPPPEDSDETPASEPAGDDGAAGDLDDPNKDKPAQPPATDKNVIHPAFDEDDKAFLKQMPRRAAEHFGKKLAGLKEQLTTAQQTATEAQSKLDAAEGKKLPDSWYEHERAYELSPQFQEVGGQFAEEQKITHFWTEQLRRCKANASAREGDAFIPYLLPGTDGKLIEVSEDQYSAEHEVTISDLRQPHYENQKALAAEAEKIQKEFTAKHKQGDSDIRAAVVDKLSWLKDDKHAFQKPFKDVLSKLPAAHKNNPFAYAFAATVVQLLYEKAARMDLEAKQKAATDVADDQRAAGPIPRGAASKKSVAADREYTMADMAGM